MDPISAVVLITVGVTVVVADECYKAYKRRKARKMVERELGLGPRERKEVRRIRKQRERERREREKEFRRRVRERERERVRRRPWNGLDGYALEGGEGGIWDEIGEGAGGLPEYSVRPREGIDSSVPGMAEKPKKKGLIKGLFRRKKKPDEPPSYEAAVGA
ncbi:hypothetical protein P691DRAFT_808606 [Macrolepiota fuliginosa MF-IS2]|uniref:Uncharacterized protein n=1 Tax=Macrolepiota fuliginosa MF-IS2 TaxID=1400762 RepID=A0A9P6CAV4_9AGAR|nr:hypothetical protein P691DRAFT_808606 [Macrolepiota fuliginosa MF-IS2]